MKSILLAILPKTFRTSNRSRNFFSLRFSNDFYVSTEKKTFLFHWICLESNYFSHSTNTYFNLLKMLNRLRTTSPKHLWLEVTFLIFFKSDRTWISSSLWLPAYKYIGDCSKCSEQPTVVSSCYSHEDSKLVMSTMARNYHVANCRQAYCLKDRVWEERSSRAIRQWLGFLLRSFPIGPNVLAI